MAKMYHDRIVAAIDVGTTKICVLVAQQVTNDQLDIIGVGKAPSDGLRKGVVVDVAKTVQSIRTAVKEAELMAGMSIESAYVGISGAHITSVNSQGMVPIAKGSVRESDIINVLAAAKAIPVAEGYQILHVLPQYFKIDGQEKLHDPRGMHGVRLEVQTHIILGAIASVQNLITCCETAGVLVNDVILEQLASADAVLSSDERELGVGVLDIGGGTSDLAVYTHGAIRHTMVLPIAGNHVTQDIAIGLRATLKDAERIKHSHGLAFCKHITAQDSVEVELVQGKQKCAVSLQELFYIINPRMQELFELVNATVKEHHLRSFMATGLVLTGGGSLLTGIRDLAVDIFDMPVRLGAPQLSYELPESLNSPVYATGYGLLIHVLSKKRKAAMCDLEGPLAKRLFARMTSWVADFF